MARLPTLDDLGARPIPESRRQIAVVRNAGAVGGAVENVGRAGMRAGMELAELDARRQAAQAGRDFAVMVGEVERYANERRENAEPGGAGHLQLIEADTDRRVNEFLTSIRDPRVREDFEARTAQLRARHVAGEDAWEIGQRRDLAVENVRESGRLLGNSLRTRPDAGALQNYIDLADSTISEQGLTGNAAVIARREWRSAMARAYVEGLTEQNAPAAQQVLRSGLLDQYLGDGVPGLVDSADAEVARREAEARRELAAARAQAQASIDMTQRRLRDGDPTLTEAELEQAAALAAQAQLPLEVYDIARARIIHRTNREFQTATGLEISGAIRDLNARIAQQGENASPDDVVRRDHLQSLLARRQQQDQNDPLTSYSQRGGVVAPLVPGDAGSRRQRIAASRAAQSETGFLRYFLPQEVPLYQERYRSGPQGRLAVINEVAAIRDDDTELARAAAEQIAPNDRTFRHAMRIGNPAAREYVVMGADARGTLPANVEFEGQRVSLNTVARNWFAAHIAPSLVRSPPEFVNDVREATINIYAELQRRSGATGEEEFNPAQLARAADLALGRSTNNRGGMGRASLGPRMPNGDPPGLLLPSTMNQAEFDARLRNDAGWAAAGNGTAVWANGQPARVGEILRRFVPVAINDGIYQFESLAGELLHTRDGGPFQLDVRRIQPRAVVRPQPQAQPEARPAIPMQPALPEPYRGPPRGAVWGVPQDRD